MLGSITDRNRLSCVLVFRGKTFYICFALKSDENALVLQEIVCSMV